MSMVRATLFCLAAFMLASGCRDVGSNSQESAAKQNPGNKKAAWLMEKVLRPEGPPKSAEELARHIQYAIQEQDKEMLAALYYRVDADGYRVQVKLLDKSIDSLLGARRQGLNRIVAVALSADEIRNRKAQTFGMKVPLKLMPELTHEVNFEYQERLEIGEKSRPTSVNAGHHAGVYYIASYQIGVAKSDED